MSYFTRTPEGLATKPLFTGVDELTVYTEGGPNSLDIRYWQKRFRQVGYPFNLRFQPSGNRESVLDIGRKSSFNQLKSMLAVDRDFSLPDDIDLKCVATTIGYSVENDLLSLSSTELSLIFTSVKDVVVTEVEAVEMLSSIKEEINSRYLQPLLVMKILHHCAASGASTLLDRHLVVSGSSVTFSEQGFYEEAAALFANCDQSRLESFSIPDAVPFLDLRGKTVARLFSGHLLAAAHLGNDSSADIQSIMQQFCISSTFEEKPYGRCFFTDLRPVIIAAHNKL